MNLRRVAIIGGNRIPFARANGAYATASNQTMLTAALEGLIERYNLHGLRMGEVVAGAVLKDSRDFSLTRECVLGSRLSPQTPAYDLQQACGTGLEAALLVANKIALGQIDCAIAGGVDSASDVPIGLNDGLRKWLLQLNRTKAPLDKVKALLQLRPSFLKPAFPRNGEPRTGLSMGQHCELMAQTWHIPRDEQDALALHSHQALSAAYHEGWEDDLLTPFQGLRRDNNLRPELTLEKLAALKPVFERSAKGTLTAGNSTPLTDGASVVLLASEEWAKARGLPVLAYLRDGETAAVDFVHGAEGLLMAPVYAVPRLLARNGLTLQDFDYYEIHEAFAAQVLCTLKAWEDAEYCRTRLGLEAPLGSIDRSKLNVKGSSLAVGHPFAATGGRIVTNLSKLLATAGQGRGLISICAAGGQGVTAILEGD
ncbi:MULTISPECIES: acetyl-CoA C-acetyltransferase [unclassified Pseudomonas]|uniref:acetyl-CoA C-acetyltransferase n=1 Tax=unclassified Pseudomonas TaxID=196821 RepID=UPI001294F7F9|nr:MULTISPECIES: acetyl-CoA C-acetyltransferase [unclassified Pseudomonas]MQT42593.1 acetyl-CoA C-acetyltransferase [Pseudomonas sp. FSL R10-0765]MQT54580.1 acetyl-CoA C-acetyltransferase [Pseudomonas sp. FSL R10-2398]MQU01615.1 acetyl-CoA C-acetyltransferase [Pseudomonas sp. FSL R10-2245]MQU14357.1 acetyl-CoA C-acetyltransferase [Pseudomonas sp. FSL R10-2189]MQU40010.1 acetyl-CoA C-acetyltransferase [Pseudomonas sp. FSL R10-2172]